MDDKAKPLKKMNMSFVSSCKSVICPCSGQVMSPVDGIANEASGVVRQFQTTAECIYGLNISNSYVL